MPILELLLEIFPQVDRRVLWAVSLEHRDVDEAVEVVLSEVLPSLDSKTNASSSLHNQELNQSPEGDNANVLPAPSVERENAGVGDLVYNARFRSQHIEELVGGESVAELREPSDAHLSTHHREIFEEANASFPSETIHTESKAVLDTVAGSSVSETTLNYHLVPSEEAGKQSFPSETIHTKSKAVLDTVAGSSVSETTLNYHLVPSEDAGKQETSVGNIFQGSQGLKVDECVVLHTDAQELVGFEALSTETTVLTNQQKISSLRNEESIQCEPAEGEERKIENGEEFSNHTNIQNQIYLEANHEVSASFSSDEDLSSTIDHSTNFRENCALVDNDTDVSAVEDETQQSVYLVENGSELLALETGMVSVSANSKSASIDSKSSQVVEVDFLEELINDAKSNKKILVSAIESVGNMVEEVEFQEERAKLATEEASKAGEDVLSKVEDLKKTLKNAKDANEMHAAEVYGERAVLATEARELQHRIVKLSDERDKSLSIIEEIRQTLEARLAAAVEEQAAAERQKLERVESAHRLHNEQELIMGRIVLESMRLRSEADENSKLREFLMDRGHAVDVLQGEIGVICEDVMLLKERVDGGLSLHKSRSSVSSSLTSLSSSVLRSILNDQASVPVGPSEVPKTLELENVTNSEEEIHVADKSQFSVDDDDDWELLRASL